MRLKSLCFATVTILLVGCDRQSTQQSLVDARQGFTTKLIRQESTGVPVAEPPPNLFRLVTYDSPLGNMPAYVSVPPNDSQQRHPAIIWIAGGFDNSIGEISWEFGPPENDQSASALWKAGVVTVYPSLRGGNQNPGYHEGFYGEVDDILAAAEFLQTQDYVDPKRIYLGGHSTGGTLALLVAECSNHFRAIFAFGPVGDVAGYGQENLPFRVSDRRETELRSPAKWLDSIHNPTFVFEGTEKRSNISELISMSHRTHNPSIHFHPINSANHFSTLAPMTALIAQKILKDDADSLNISFSDEEMAAAFRK